MFHQRFKTANERFDEKYTKRPDGCWVWKTGPKHEYPKFWVKPGYVRASRFSWERFNNQKIAGGMQVLHKCDNPKCVNPDHLFLGDRSANMLDRSKKGRFDISGLKNGRARVTKEMARQIKALRTGGLSQQKIADRIGVSQQVVSRVVRGEHWTED